MLTSDQLREAYLGFFEGKGHSIIPSSSLVPADDPTLLLTSAGMVQFKRYFKGEAVPPNPRMTSCQKCFRTSDIDSVGDATHLTFFEMLGNFSIGDYFKKEAIAWAWEFVIQHLKLPRERLWITIYQDDDEALQHWIDIGVPAERVLRFGAETNFWGPAGKTGPCGPCSEIHYDFGESVGCGKPDCRPNCSCGRYIELWNLVFTQYDQDEQGNRSPLPKPNIDTGMGLERTVAAVNGKMTAYETDLFTPILKLVSELTGKSYGQNKEIDRAFRVVVEHGRGICFLIADGVIPSNEGRGYVLRRILRRAALFGRKLGLTEPFLTKIAELVISRMKHSYPELAEHRKFILQVIESEEDRFERTLEAGTVMLDEIVNRKSVIAAKRIPGPEAFMLYDTYGFPVELTQEIARDRGLEVDLKGFEDEMERQRERARASHKFELAAKSGDAYEKIISESRFIGYERFGVDGTKVAGLIVKGEAVNSVKAGQDVEVVLDETPFYGEMGGQVGDKGEIKGPKARVEVTDAIRANHDLIIHRGKVIEGELSIGDKVIAHVKENRRRAIASNHTATHLLQAALRQVLGKQVRQAGSLVTPERFRFDFTFLGSPEQEQLLQIQRLVNQKIRENLPVTTRFTDYRTAVAEGALSLAGELYGDKVRVLEIGKPIYSAELCGGTHVSATGEIGQFYIVSESSIGSGIRRIEAVTGEAAELFAEQRLAVLEAISKELHASPEETQAKIASLLSELDKARKHVQALERELARSSIDSLLGKAEQVDGVTVLSVIVQASNMPALREMGDLLREKLKSAVVVLGAVYDDKPSFLALVTPDLVTKGLNAGKIVKQVAAITGGGGGGKPEMAQAGGKDKAKIDEALNLVKTLVKPK